MSKLRVLDLFSGIGGFSLGLERTGGFETVAFCEIEDYPRRVLAKHWPDVPIYDDVRTLTHERLSQDGIAVDVICGGFPCQDISLAGKGAGLAGERSGLWREYARLVGELRPRYVLVENVAALLGRGLGDVLGDLAALGYDAEWHCIPAAAVGAPHRRDRLWIVAYPESQRCREARQLRRKQPEERSAGCGKALADASRIDGREGRARGSAGGGAHRAALTPEELGNPYGTRLEIRQGISSHLGEELATAVGAGWWAAEPDVGRVADGVPNRVHRLRGLGNAVVPQIPELIGRAILVAEGRAAA